MRRLILASSSPYRRALLDRLGLPYEALSPDIDESAVPGEAVEQLVQRLALGKARAIAAQHPDALVIGSDQVAYLDGQLLTKPGDHDRAVQQLQQASGKAVVFHTGLCLLDAMSGEALCEDVTYSVHFRVLTAVEIEAYLQRERPYDCAGSFKSEGLGITLFERLEGDDPNSLIGLPLIRLCAMLRQMGVAILG